MRTLFVIRNSIYEMLKTPHGPAANGFGWPVNGCFKGHAAILTGKVWALMNKERCHALAI